MPRTKTIPAVLDLVGHDKGEPVRLPKRGPLTLYYPDRDGRTACFPRISVGLAAIELRQAGYTVDETPTRETKMNATKLGNRCSIDEALAASSASGFPEDSLLRNLAIRARENGRTEDQAAGAFRSTPTFHALQQFLGRVPCAR